MQVHGFQLIKVAYHHARRNSQCPAERDTQMGEVSADAGTPFGGVRRGGGRIAHAVFVSHLAKDPASDRFDLWIAGGASFDDRGGQFQHLVGLAVAARQKIMEHVVGKVLYQREIRVGIRGDLIGRLDGAGASDYRPALPKHGSLLKVSEGVVKFGQVHLAARSRGDFVSLPDQGRFAVST